MQKPNLSNTTEKDERVLTAAVLRAAETLKVNKATLARIIGTSPASVTRLTQGETISRGSKVWEMAVLFIRLFRSLDAITAGDSESAISWLNSNNTDLDGKPIALIEKLPGLVNTVDYVDGFRAKI